MTFQSEKFFNSENVTKSKNIVCMQKEFFPSCTIESRDTKGQSYTFLIKWKKKKSLDDVGPLVQEQLRAQMSMDM